MSVEKTIVVHDQTFHADDAFACFVLLNTEEFRGAKIIRTRNQEIIDKADAVADVGGIYDPEKRRYDHHQLSFNFRFPGCEETLCAAAGAVYYHHGKEAIANILKQNNRDAGEHLEYLWNEMYFVYLKELDCIDNGVNMYPTDVEPVYSINTGICARIAMMNPHWKTVNPDPYGQFLKAVELVGSEFTARLLYMLDSQIPAMDVVKRSYESRFDVDPSGKIMVLAEACGFEKHLKRLEEEHEDSPRVLYVLSQRNDGSYNVKAVGTGKGFELRKALPFPGLRDEELSKASGIPGAIFVHKSGFLGAYKELEHAIEFAKLALAQPTPEILPPKKEKKTEETKPEEKPEEKKE